MTALKFLKNRRLGVGLFLIGAIILLGYWLAPVPDFDELEQRTGIVEDARRDRIWFCRRSLGGDCAHTVVDVRHAGGVRSYNFAQTPVDDVEVRAEIELWVAPSIKGFDADRVWHAEQGGRVIRDYEHQARADRQLIWFMVPLAPFLLFGGWWLTRRYDWQGNPVEKRASTSERGEPFSD